MRHAILFAVAIVGLSGSFITSIAQAPAEGWSPRLAADYLDSRQKAWFAWKNAASADGPCVSCHTGMSYLLARPALRRALGESEPTVYERGLLDRLRAKAGAKPPSALQSVEAIFTAMFLSDRDAHGAASDDTRRAFEQLRSLQVQEGAAKGGWTWFSANLDPWENPRSPVFGAALAARAVGIAGERAENRELTEALVAYLASSLTPTQALHDRLAILWAASDLPRVMPDATRKALIAETLAKQGADGGWTLEAIGPWMTHATAPAQSGSHAYATAFVTYVLAHAGVPSQEPLTRARAWLKAHQNPKTGAWPAVSMNKSYPPDSMEVLFMQDAATAFAALALLETR